MKKKTKLRWDRIIGTLFCTWMIISFIGMAFGPTQTKHTPVGDYTTKGYPFCLKIASGSEEVYNYVK